MNNEANQLFIVGDALKALTVTMVLTPEQWPFPHLPELPRHLEFLDARNLQLETLPPLPSTLVVLLLSGNKTLKSLPPLPPSIEELLVDDTGITELPPLPLNLVRLECQNTTITALPELSPNLVALLCYNTNLAVLPALPPSLRSLNCAGSPLTVLPTLPADLSVLACGSCRLRMLPRLPALTTVVCMSNPWAPEFATIFPPITNMLGYLGACHEQKAAVNAYHDVQEIKAKARDAKVLAMTLARTEALPCDLTNHVGAFLSGHCSTLENQVATLFAQTL